MSEAPPPTRQMAVLGASLDDVLERMRVPAYLLAADGRIRWLNGAARKLVGECRGRSFLDVVVPQDRTRASAAFNDKILGRKDATELRLDVLPTDVPNAADRWVAFQRAVRSRLVVVVEPVWQRLAAVF